MCERRNCRYISAKRCGSGSMVGEKICGYAIVAGQTRSGALLQQLGKKKLSKEDLELLKGERCTFFRPKEGKHETIQHQDR